MNSVAPIEMDLFRGAVPENLLFICGELCRSGFEAYLVGGAVRDLVLYGGYENVRLNDSDFDFTTNATPEQIMALFGKKGRARVYTVPTGVKHGTVSVIIEKEGVASQYEVTTYRIDGPYPDGRRPEKVTYTGSLLEDLSRRDFTVNAMAYDITRRRLYDPFNGLDDILKNRLIKAVGDPAARFSEDGLRPVRACRLAAVLGFKIEPATLNAIPGALDTVAMISVERFQEELLKLMKAPRPSVGLEYMRETGILKLFIPELLEGFEFDQNEYHLYDVYYHNLYTCDNAAKDRPLVRIAALFHDIGKPRAKKFALTNGNGNVFYNHEIIGEKMADRIMKRLKFSNHDIKTITRLIRMHMFYYTEEWTDGAVRRFIRKAEESREFLADLFLLRKADRLGSGLKEGDAEILGKFRNRIEDVIRQDSAMKVTDLDINGNDIMEAFRLKPSRIIGEMLDYMLEKVLDSPELNNRGDLLQIGGDFLRNYSDIKKQGVTEEENMEIMI